MVRAAPSIGCEVIRPSRSKLFEAERPLPWIQDCGAPKGCQVTEPSSVVPLRVKAGFKVQAQGLSYLARRDPVGGHSGPKNRPACPTLEITRGPTGSST